ncbi:MAG: MBL fold metallo-hydrolase [Fibrobacteres bacterium]|nr:MBL fold metallo-hydrolase [Fibrobacterota bacterium]
MTETKLQVLRSSSSGNCTAIWSGQEALFVDAGVPRRLLDEFIADNALKPRALLVTHAHADHLTNPAVNFFKDHSAPVYMGREDMVKAFCKYIPAIRKHRETVRIFSGPFSAGSYHIVPFELDHDSIGGCFGYNIRINGKTVVVATDLVNTPLDLVKHFKGADTVVFESNHDVEMLQLSGRPEYLKTRIREKGHLSNEKSASFLAGAIKNSPSSPKHIFLAHISHECNTHAKALSVHNNVLLPLCDGNTELHLTHRDRFSDIVVL